MLEEIQATDHDSPTFRLVAQVRHVERLRSLGLDADEIEEMIDLLRDRELTDDVSDILDGPFADKPFNKSSQTRFSDGTLRVFYSALEPETAEREIRHWYLKPILEGQVRPVRVFYRLAKCSFGGQVKDLRPKVAEWPFLIADGGYPECNAIGAEAAGAGLAGLLSQSARRPEGTTLPIFLRESLRNSIEFYGYRSFFFDPATGAVTITAAE